MLSWRQRKAIKLMFQMTDEEVAREVGIRTKTLAAWRRSPEFREALVAEVRAVRAATARIASQATLAAAKNLHKVLAEGKDSKILLDALKASGAFEGQEDLSEDALEDIVRQVMSGE